MQDPRLEVHLHRLSPLFKAIIINDDVMYLGLYPIAATPISINGVEAQLWDYRGERARMLGYGASGSAIEREQFLAVRQWFDSVWDNVAQPDTVGPEGGAKDSS